MTNGVFSLYYADGEHLCTFVKRSDCHFETIINSLNNFFIELDSYSKRKGGRLNWEYVAVQMICFFDKAYDRNGIKLRNSPPPESDNSYITEFHITPIYEKYRNFDCPILEAIKIKMRWASGTLHKEGVLSDIIENLELCQDE